MVNEQFVRDIQKGIGKQPLRQTLPAGATPRRYEPAGGVKKHNERIHRESAYADKNKDLPFTFRKPPKPIGRSNYIKCDNCGHVSTGTTSTVGIICNDCGKFSTVTEVTFDG